MSNILSLENFNKALARKKWDLKRLANEYDKKYPSENGRTIYNTLRRWRSPNGNPTLNILVRVCDLLECDIDYFLQSFNRFLIISLDVLICRYSPLLRAFPALFISEEPHKSFYYPSCFHSQK